MIVWYRGTYTCITRSAGLCPLFLLLLSLSDRTALLSFSLLSRLFLAYRLRLLIRRGHTTRSVALRRGIRRSSDRRRWRWWVHLFGDIPLSTSLSSVTCRLCWYTRSPNCWRWWWRWVSVPANSHRWVCRSGIRRVFVYNTWRWSM